MDEPGNLQRHASFKVSLQDLNLVMLIHDPKFLWVI
jgi:hypothetical protein